MKIKRVYGQKLDLEAVVGVLSSFPALLIEVIVGLLLFAVVINMGSLVLAAYGENMSASATWSMPRGYVFQTNTPKQTCQSDGTSCKLYKQWPGQRVDYNVTTVAGSVIYTGSVYANSSGVATPKWDWDYAIAAYPGSSCSNTDCKTANINNQTASSVSYVVNGLKENTDYKIVVCAPNCGQSGNVKLYDASIRTGQAAKITNTVVGTNCNGNGRVRGEFYWNRATGFNLSVQYVDLSFSSSFSPSTTSGTLVSFGTDPHKLVRDDLAPNTTYYWRVNSRIGSTNAWVTSEYRTFKTPACVTVTPVGAELGGVIANCRLDGKVNLYFTWKQATGADYDVQYVDWSTSSGFPSGYGSSGALTMDKAGFGVNDLTPNTKYYWRVNSHIRNTYSLISSKPVVGEYTANCAAPEKPATGTIGCQNADFNKDGLVNVQDTMLTAKNYGNVTDANRIYDLFKDSNNVVDLKDSYIVGYLYTSNCIPRDYATKLKVTPVCMSQTSTSLIRLQFSWTTSTTDRTAQFVDLSEGNTFAPGTYTGRSAGTTGTTLNVDNFEKGKTYYTRVNTRNAAGAWNASAVVSVTTPTICNTPLPVPTNLVADLGTGTGQCADSKYGVTFGWNTAAGANWFIDVKARDLNFATGTFSSAALPVGATSFLSDGQQLNPALNFEPGVSYYWRIWNGEAHTYPTQGYFVRSVCPSQDQPPAGGGGAFSQDAFKSALKARLGDRRIIIPSATGGNGTLENFGMVLYGMAGAESSWNQSVCNSTNHCGIFQYNPTSWAAHAARLTAKTGRTYDRLNGWDQMDVVINLLEEDGCYVNGPGCAGTLWTHWQADFNNDGHDWIQFIAGY